MEGGLIGCQSKLIGHNVAKAPNEIFKPEGAKVFLTEENGYRMCSTILVHCTAHVLENTRHRPHLTSKP